MALNIRRIKALAEREAVKAGQHEATIQQRRLRTVAFQSFVRHHAKRTGSPISSIIVMVNNNMGIKIYSPTFYFGIRNYEKEVEAIVNKLQYVMLQEYTSTIIPLFAQLIQQTLLKGLSNSRFFKVRVNSKSIRSLRRQVSNRIRRLISRINI